MDCLTSTRKGSEPIPWIRTRTATACRTGVRSPWARTPLDPDTDGDGIPDGTDPDVLGDVLGGLPDEAFAGGGHRTAMQAILDTVERHVAEGRIDEAIGQLENLRRHVDGCGPSPDGDDWIIDCTVQLAVRGYHRCPHRESEQLVERGDATVLAKPP